MKVKSAFSKICLFATIAALCPALHARATFTRTGQYDPADEIQALKDEIERLKAEILRLQAELQQQVDANRWLDQNNKDLLAQLAQFSTDNQAFRTSQASYDTELENVRHRNAELEELQKTKQAEFDRLQEQLAILQQKLDKSEDRDRVRSNELLDEKAENESLQEQLRKARQELEEFQKSRAIDNDLAAENQTLREQLEGLQTQLIALGQIESQLKEFQIRYAALEAKNKACDEKKAELEAEIARLRQINSEQQVALETALADHNLSEKEAIILLQQQLDEEKAKNKRCDEEKELYKTHNNELNVSLAALQAQVTNLSEELEASKKANTDCDEEKKALEKQIVELEVEIARLNEALEISEKARKACESTLIAEMEPRQRFELVDEDEIFRQVIESEIQPPEPNPEPVIEPESPAVDPVTVDLVTNVAEIFKKPISIKLLQGIPASLANRTSTITYEKSALFGLSSTSVKGIFDSSQAMKFRSYVTEALSFWKWNESIHETERTSAKKRYVRVWKNYFLSGAGDLLFGGIGFTKLSPKPPSEFKEQLARFQVKDAQSQLKSIGTTVAQQANSTDDGPMRDLVQAVKINNSDVADKLAATFADQIAAVAGASGSSVTIAAEIMLTIKADLEKVGFGGKVITVDPEGSGE